MKKIIHIFLSVMILCSVFSGCAGGKKDNGKLKVAGLIRNDKESFLLAYTDALKEAAKNMDVNLEVYICDDDAAIQIDQVKTLLTGGTKYFVMTPVETGMTAQVTKLVQSMGGAVAFSNIVPSDESLDVGKNFFYASSAEISAGDFQAQILDDYFKKNPSKLSGKTVNILYLDGEYGHTAQIFRRQGFFDGMDARGYKVNVLGEGGANWGFDSAKQIISNFLGDFGSRIDAVVCQNDDMALGAVAALMDAGYYDENDSDGDGTNVSVPVLGVDATAAACQSIKEKKLYATVLQDAKGQASTALELVVQCSEHGSAKGFETSQGVKSATKVTGEAPLTRNSVMDQCFIVPFVPVTE